MRTWKRAPVTMYCGRCRAAIQCGEPYEEIQPYLALKHPKRRCAKCAETDRPPDIWTRTTALPLPLSFARFQSSIVVPREPGSDD